MRPHARNNPTPAQLYAKSHHLSAALVGMGTTLLLQTLVGVQRIQLPNSDVVFPYRMLLPIGLSLSILTVLSSEMSEQENIAANRVKHKTRWVVCGLSLACIALEFVEAFLFFIPGEGVTYARSFLIWTLIGVLFGCFGMTRCAWLIPLGTAIPLTYFDPFVNQKPAWWNFPITSGNSTGGWVFLAALAALVLVSFSLERKKFFRRRFSPLI